MVNPKEEPAPAASASAALFQQDGDNSLAEGFRDKVASLHSFFDRDGDGYLNHTELRGLQLLTSGSDMHQGQYVMVCKSIGCDPREGISLDALKLVYASDGTSIASVVTPYADNIQYSTTACYKNVEEDYLKVFGNKESETEESHKSGEDDVIEVGEDGVDISS
ncbi:hypothetical protein ACHAXR_011929 [Thalassiosira sp. AJA248-18]